LNIHAKDVRMFYQLETPMVPKINYLNNKDILEEIHKSKNTYSSFTLPEYHRYDIIVTQLSEITEEIIAEAKINRAKWLGQKKYEEHKAAGEKVKLIDCTVEPESIPKTSLIFRVMTFDHIPLNNARKKNPKTEADRHDKVNFPPFMHWKFDDEDQLMCVGKSHWIGDVNTGKFSKDHGKITNKLAMMYIKLSERYATKGNVRGYCVDSDTEALTDHGWKNINTITEDQKILSYHQGRMVWSKIKSVFRGDYHGRMHQMTGQGFDSLVTPEHKFVTARGLVKAEDLTHNEQLVMIGQAMSDRSYKKYSDSFVELVGWVMSCGEMDSGNGLFIQKRTEHSATKIAKCLNDLDYDYYESALHFRISHKSSEELKQLIPDCQLSMNFVCDLTNDQRMILINTITNYSCYSDHSIKYSRNASKSQADAFQMLCAMSGIRTHSYLVNNRDECMYQTYLLKDHYTIGIDDVDFHGGRTDAGIVPTYEYSGKIWCPETEYGCFVARRNGRTFLTGNTYKDEMKGQAILQLTQFGLQFDESKSSNPFAYYTAACTNSFVRVINEEKKNQEIRDDLLELNGLDPSYTRTGAGEYNAAMARNSGYEE